MRLSAVMAPKPKEKIVSAKGDDAEKVEASVLVVFFSCYSFVTDATLMVLLIQMVLDYMRQVNRPYAATDISANLKQAVSKAAAQKALLSLSDKGLLHKKEYGKQTIFVIDQDSLPETTPEAISTLQAEISALDPVIEAARSTVKKLTEELNTLTESPRTVDLPGLIASLEAENAIQLSNLRSLESGAPPISAEKLEQAELVWKKERAQWVQRRKIYKAVIDQLTPDMNAEERAEWEEGLGIEPMPSESRKVEESKLCVVPSVVRAKRPRQGSDA
ncbi:TBP-1 interacting protein [Phaffia rhodozyma]|uniref:TBP-1 interacting protein n=1 Tax=Phaffia rhodozyma TaxID=264483 RepID=A0A0F7SL33_PHARH|nr:TBP-1 interacting protein [Phaffia rhodozyma]